MITIRLFPEDGAEWPLWDSRPDYYQAEPSDYELSDGLTENIEHWQSIWRQHWLNGWDSEKAKADWLRVGEEVRQQLMVELGDGYTVIWDRKPY